MQPPYPQTPYDPLARVAQLDQLFVQQKFAPVANIYRISTVGPDGRSEGEPLAFVRQKRLRIRERIDFYADEAQTVPLMRLQARKVFEVHAPDGRQIGKYTRIAALRDRYILDLSGDPQRWFDRRVAMAFTVALDA